MRDGDADELEVEEEENEERKWRRKERKACRRRRGRRCGEWRMEENEVILQVDVVTVVYKRL